MGKFQILTFLLVFLVLDLKMYGQGYPMPPYAASPLCVTQFSLVNRACALVPFTPGPPPSPPSPPDDDGGGGGDNNDDDDDDGDDDDDDDDGDNDGNEGRHHDHDNGGQHHDHANEGGHHDDGHEGGHHRNRRHRHGHRRHRHHETPSEHDCCRWMRAVDNECVCELLLHLPAFLLKMNHNYTVRVNDECDVTFECGGLFRF